MISTALAVLVFIAIVAAAGVALAWLSDTDSTDNQDSPDDAPKSEQQLIEAVNNLLPQTQCAQCGHPGCRPYANAIVQANAPINQCPPGGDSLIRDLASYLGKDVIPLNTQFGESKPAQLALIDEATCIGCTLCIAACPVDAIVGASRLMHTVIASQCTGCELCLPPCPVDCISLIPEPVTLNRWHWPRPA